MASYQEQYQAFLDKQKQPDYNWDAMTSEEQASEQAEYTRLKILSAQEIERVSLFYQARADAFNKLSESQQKELADLSILWQSYQDKGFVIPV